MNRHGTAKVTLPDDLSILITRQFDAPAHILYKAVTTPALVKRWWGFDDWEWLACEIDLRVGGRWRYLTRGPEGQEVGFHGEYLELAPPLRLVNTEIYDPFPDAPATCTWTLTEENGVTTMTTLVVHLAKEHRDGHIASGMEGGLQISMDRLDDLARSL
jgi:uncharacterized protein YndB with AHSA1/START domain